MERSCMPDNHEHMRLEANDAVFEEQLRELNVKYESRPEERLRIFQELLALCVSSQNKGVSASELTGFDNEVRLCLGDCHPTDDL